MATEARNTLEDRWLVMSRWQEYLGEYRAAILRLIGIAAFYAVELVNYYGLSLGWLELPSNDSVTRDFHIAITSLAVAWTMFGVGIILCLRNQLFPRWLKFFATAVDLAMLTAVLMLGQGPRSPLLAAYFVLIALSALRFSLPLIRCATVGAMLCYLFLSGYARWFTDRDLTVPRYHQLIFLIALGLTGIIIGQVLRLISQTPQWLAGPSTSTEVNHGD